MNAVCDHDRFPSGDAAIPRFREAGDVTLDLLHRDGRVEDRWLGLSPRQFALLWRLAERPGEPVSDASLLADVWRIGSAPGTESIAARIARVRARLEPFGLACLIAEHRDGGYVLDVPPAAGLWHRIGAGAG